jgi:hypothetical protein
MERFAHQFGSDLATFVAQRHASPLWLAAWGSVFDGAADAFTGRIPAFSAKRVERLMPNSAAAALRRQR